MFSCTASKFFLKLLVTIPVAPIITGIIVHFRFQIHCICIHKLLYFNFFSASFCTAFLSAGIATSISVYVFSFLFLIIISGLFCCNFTVCVLLDSTTLWHLPLHTLAWVCVCICLWFHCLRLCILSNGNVYTLYRVSLNIRSSPKMGHSEVKWSIVSSCCLHNRHLLSISSFKIVFLNNNNNNNNVFMYSIACLSTGIFCQTNLNGTALSIYPEKWPRH